MQPACWQAVVIAAITMWMVGGLQPAVAQELEPRTYANTPTGVNLLAVAYALSSGNVLLDPTLPIENLDGTLNIGLVGYGRTFGLFKRNAKFKTFVPYGFGDWQGSLAGVPGERDTSGFGDIRAKLEWNFVGAPAMDSQVFQNYQQQTIVGASVLIVAPTGVTANTSGAGTEFDAFGVRYQYAWGDL